MISLKKKTTIEGIEVKGQPVGRFIFALQAFISVAILVIVHWWPERASGLGPLAALLAVLSCQTAYAMWTRGIVAVYAVRADNKPAVTK